MPGEPVPPIPDNLRVLYDLARLSGESNIQILIERIARAEARVAELEAQVERLSAPVSDEEWDYRHVGPFTHGCVSRSQVNVIIAARAAEPSKEGKYEQL